MRVTHALILSRQLNVQSQWRRSGVFISHLFRVFLQLTLSKYYFIVFFVEKKETLKNVAVVFQFSLLHVDRNKHLTVINFYQFQQIFQKIQRENTVDVIHFNKNASSGLPISARSALQHRCFFGNFPRTCFTFIRKFFRVNCSFGAHR